MQSPAMPYGRPGFVTGAKHIGLESFRVRNCDPDADYRLPTDRASRCWNEVLELDCDAQSTGLHAQGWLFVTRHENDRRSLLVDGVESQTVNESLVTLVTMGNSSEPCGAARHRLRYRSFSCPRVDFGSIDIQQAVHPFGLVCASGRIAPSFVLSEPFLFWGTRHESPQHNDASPSGVRPTTIQVVARTCSRNGLRTHSLTRVSDEKRNANERPPTGGKSNCHR